MGGQLGFQLVRIGNAIRRDIDSDKDHHVPLAAGYEYLETDQTGEFSHEDRITLDARSSAGRTASTRRVTGTGWGSMPTSGWGTLRFAAYTSAEAFHDSAHGWYEAQYTVGLQVPYRRLLMVDTYYLRQECDTCSPNPLNVWGLTLNVFLRNGS